MVYERERERKREIKSAGNSDIKKAHDINTYYKIILNTSKNLYIKYVYKREFS